MQAWELYESGELLSLVDTSLNGDFNEEEAFRYLKIALLCTQDMPKLRPSMSTVVRLLSGEQDVKETEISRPGLLSDFTAQRNYKGQSSGGTGTGSSDASNNNDSSSSSRNITTSYATMTFSSIYDRTN